jgi:phenylacetate-coenzyme A ligase PaaK-like adenylate-forming protein
MDVCGARPEFRMINAFPFAPHLAFWLTHYAGTEFGVLVTSTGGGKVMGTEGNLRLVRKLIPDVIIGVPTFVYHLLHQAADEGLRCENLKKIVLGGEKVSDGLRQRSRRIGCGRALDVWLHRGKDGLRRMSLSARSIAQRLPSLPRHGDC